MDSADSGSKQLLSFIVAGDRPATDDVYRKIAEALLRGADRERAAAKKIDARTVGAFKLLAEHDADAGEWGYTVLALGSGYRDGGAKQLIAIDGAWTKTRDGAIAGAESSLALLLGDTLTELGLDGRSYEDGTAMTFERVVPGGEE